MKPLVVFLALMQWATVAQAHKPSDSYLQLRIDGATVRGQWDIALRDLEDAVGLDRDADGAITWGELRAAHDAIGAYALGRLRIDADGSPCPTEAREHLVDSHTDGAYAVLRFVARCRVAPLSLQADYRLLFDLDAQHRGLLTLEGSAGVQTTLFSVDRPNQVFEVAAPRAWRQLWVFWCDGVWHIWIGFDHILFLLTLLMPAVLRREAGRWRGVARFRAAFVETVKIVTAFTVAHSVTLSLASLGMIHLPSRLVEAGIAASVVVSALNNAHPLFHQGRWLVAFAFGLLHGFGFASVLAEPGLPGGPLLLALLGFNTGVEAGQLAIVAAFLPLAYVARRSWFYQRFTLVAGSSLIATLATIWMVERMLEIKLLGS